MYKYLYLYVFAISLLTFKIGILLSPLFFLIVMILWIIEHYIFPHDVHELSQLIEIQCFVSKFGRYLKEQIKQLKEEKNMAVSALNRYKVRVVNSWNIHCKKLLNKVKMHDMFVLKMTLYNLFLFTHTCIV